MDMSDDVAITIPRHAARFLGRLLFHERQRMAKQRDGLSLQSVAAADSLEALEYALPDEFHLDPLP
jgi:hypothetical protein